MTYIFESPDGGKTVYARESGTLEPRRPVDSQEQMRILEWQDIYWYFKDDPELQQELDRVRMIYYLRKQHG
jgi:hypothetical protein